MDAQKLLAKAILLPLDFDPFKPPKQHHSAAEKAEELKRNKDLHHQGVRQNIIALSAQHPPASSPVTAPPRPPTDSHARLIRALQPPTSRPDPRRPRDTSATIRPDTPLPSAASIDASHATPATAALLRTLALLDTYDNPGPPANAPTGPRGSGAGSVSPELARKNSLPSSQGGGGWGRGSRQGGDMARRQSMGDVRSSVREDRVEGFVRPALPQPSGGSVLDRARDPRQRKK